MRQFSGTAYDTGCFAGYSFTRGSYRTYAVLTLQVTEVELQPLPEEQHSALLELQSREGGVNMPEHLGHFVGYPEESAFTPAADRHARVNLTGREPMWKRDEHPCTWGGRFAGANLGCCVAEDGSTSVTSLIFDPFVHIYRG